MPAPAVVGAVAIDVAIFYEFYGGAFELASVLTTPCAYSSGIWSGRGGNNRAKRGAGFVGGYKVFKKSLPSTTLPFAKSCSADSKQCLR